MLSPVVVKIIKIMPESLLVKFAKRTVSGFLKKYATIHTEGFENIAKAEGAKIFVCNHLSNADGLVLDKILKEKYDPTFVAGEKLSDDPVTNLGTKIVKNITIKPNSADREAIQNMISILKDGNNLFLFPEGTRSRTGAMIEGKKGILLVARLSKAQIVPVSMWGTDKLLPINEGGTMADEAWNHADVHVKFGEPITLPRKKEEGESKHEFDERSLNTIMMGIAKGLPEEYRGVYSDE